MKDQFLEITIYGAEQRCASCVNAPSSKDTKEWLEAALSRRFPHQEIAFRYVDLYEPKTKEDHEFTAKILNDDYFYPLIVANNEVLGEGNPRLKNIFQYIENQGFRPVSE